MRRAVWWDEQMPEFTCAGRSQSATMQNFSPRFGLPSTGIDRKSVSESADVRYRRSHTRQKVALAD